MNFLKPKGIVAVGLLTASVAMFGYSSGSSAEESSLTPELKAELQALIDSYRGEPEFVAPGDPIDIKAALGGKLIYGISVTSVNPFTEGIYTSIRKLERSSVSSSRTGRIRDRWPNISGGSAKPSPMVPRSSILRAGRIPGSWVRNSRKRAPQELR